MHTLLRRTGGAALFAMALTAIAALALPGVGFAAGLLAAAATGMATFAVEIVRPGAGREPTRLLPLVPGLLAASATLALPAAAASPEMLALAAFAAAGLLVGGAARVAQCQVALEDAVDDLRARLLRREGDVRVQADRIRRLDVRDPATGALNARAFDDALAQVLAPDDAGAVEPLALLIVELPGRDAVPLAVDAARRAVRASDLVARLDEREVAVLLGGCRDPRPVLVRMRRMIGARDRELLERTRIAGITVPPDAPPPRPDQLLEAAWAALDAARRLDDARGAQAVWPLEWGLAKVAGG
ncbi:MAG: hypothetical protein Kow0062_19540 [Acidobacteriota bacterium]